MSWSDDELPKVLIIDDDPAVVAAFARLLEAEHYETVTALGVETGLLKVQMSHPDAVLLDFKMPLMDGLEFLRRLRACPEQQDTPVAIVTGDYFIDEATTRNLRELKAELYYKPLWLADLVRIATRLTSRTRSARNPPS